jgi:hypothetical protein
METNDCNKQLPEESPVCPVCLENVFIDELADAPPDGSTLDTKARYARGPLSDLDTTCTANLSDSIASLIRVCNTHDIAAVCIDAPCQHSYHAQCLKSYIDRCDTNACALCRRSFVTHESVRPMCRANAEGPGTRNIYTIGDWRGSDPAQSEWNREDERSCVTIGVIAAVVTLVGLAIGCS